MKEILADGNGQSFVKRPDTTSLRSMLEIRNGVVYDPKMAAPKLSAQFRKDGKILIHPDPKGDIRCYNGVIDLSSLLETIGKKGLVIYHHDMFGIVIEFRRRDSDE